jgi:hypothetical protein
MNQSEYKRYQNKRIKELTKELKSWSHAEDVVINIWNELEFYKSSKYALSKLSKRNRRPKE